MERTIKRLLQNFFSLNLVQFANYIFPLITLPYIVRIIGPERYGTINFAQAVIQYFTLVVLYSFDLSITREVSAHRDDRVYLSRIFYTVLSARLLLFFCLAVPLMGLLLIPRFATNWQIYIALYCMNLGFALFPMFLYQGIEEIQKVAFFNFLIKLIFTISIFIFLRTESDYLFVPVSTSLGYLVVGIIACIYAIYRYSLMFYRVKLREIALLLHDGFRLFVSSITINLYTTTNTVLLGLFIGDVAVGYFAAAEKIVTIVQSLTLYPLTQTLYPFFSKTMHDDHRRGVKILEQGVVWVGVITFFLSVIVTLLGPTILRILYGTKFIPATSVLTILAWLLFLRGLSGMCGIQGLLNLKMDTDYLRITTVGMFFCLILNVFLLPHFAERGTALAWIITETYIAGAMYTVLKKKGVLTLTFSKIRTILSRVPYV
ncbi:MAG: flippase [Bacteroidetes bacterium]|nr:flippase [Bacteroidota bacterium]